MSTGDALVAGLQAAVLAHAESKFDRACDQVVEETRQFAPVGLTGATRDSIKIWNRTVSGTLVSAEIVAQGGGTFSDAGTQGPYIIRAHGKVLAFFWNNGPRGPGDYFYRFVTHPGVRARNWFKAAMPDRFSRALGG